AHVVRSCSDSFASGAAKEDWDIRKTRYIEHLYKADKDALLVSLSDKVHNARSILRDLRKPEIGPSVRDRFKNSKEKTLRNYPDLGKAFPSCSPGELSDVLAAIISDLETDYAGLVPRLVRLNQPGRSLTRPSTPWKIVPL